MRITKIEGTVEELTKFYSAFQVDNKKRSTEIKKDTAKELAEFDGAFQADNKKPSIEIKNFQRDNKFPKFKSQEEITAFVDETISNLKRKEFNYCDICNFLSSLKSASRIIRQTFKPPKTSFKFLLKTGVIVGTIKAGDFMENEIKATDKAQPLVTIEYEVHMNRQFNDSYDFTKLENFIKRMCEVHKGRHELRIKITGVGF